MTAAVTDDPKAVSTPRTLDHDEPRASHTKSRARRQGARSALRAGGTIGSLGLLLGGAVWLSGSSTLSLGVRQDVPDGARPALLLVLEVAAVVGTALWVTARDGKEMVRPGIVVVIAGGVTGVGGFLAYNWLGLVAPVMSVLVTDMIAQRWKRTHTADTRTEQDAEAPDTSTAPALHVVPDRPVREVDDTDPGLDCTLVTAAQLDDLVRDELRVVADHYKVTKRGSAKELRDRLRPLVPCEAHTPHREPHTPHSADASAVTA